MTQVRDILFLDDADRLLEDPSYAQQCIEGLRAGDVYIQRGAYNADLLDRIEAYLRGIGQHSLPNYVPIEQGAPNHHRMSRFDERAYVGGCFHQFAFFPWNQDVFDLFSVFRRTYEIKNVLCGHPPGAFLGRQTEQGCTARLAFQCYPRGGGCLNLHADPVDYHQLVVPVMVMGERGRHFQQGGAYVQRADGERVWLDDAAGRGGVVYFNAQLPHGVAPIDPEAPMDWLSFQGRWMLLFAVNRLAGNTSIGNSVDLTSGG